MYSIGEHFWVNHASNDEFAIPRGCKILRIDQQKVQIQDDDSKVEWITMEKILKPIHASSVSPVHDMIHLGDLQEYSILRNLHIRYNNQLIYTYIGNMLIAVNPYQVLNIYSMNEVSLYSERKSETLPPHIFAISDKCFLTMKDTKKNQCILISGESGAGKTESTKLILQYLTTISAGGHSWIKHQILEANPLLEAFGNAKTQRNDNSSRFGKYINIFFNNSGEIEGASIDYYLLEKSRIVSQLKNERNYHIFYAILAGLSIEEKQKLNLGNVADYKYLHESGICKDRNDTKTFTDIKTAMQVLNCTEETILNVISLLATILHLGNLKYKATTIAYADATEIHDISCLRRISNILAVDEKTLIHVLTKKSIFAKEEQVVSNLSKDQACEVRDAFAKLVYEKIFEKIVQDINKTIYNSKGRAKSTIGILDISGFENFDTNSFEQLCINYANENLQQFFVQHIFKMEQQNYIKEGIFWSSIEFIDNQEIIDMIGVKPLNVMSLIDEESIFPKASDNSMLSKLSLIHGNNRNFIKPKSPLVKAFGIVHFAGPVSYDIAGFLDKNRDIFSGDLKKLVAASTNDFFKSLFTENELQVNHDSNKRSQTLSTKFRDSLDLLLSNLRSCNPFFVRCIKPNENKLPQVFDKTMCCRQLRYAGLMETARIRKAGYPLRYDYTEFVRYFNALARGISRNQSGEGSYKSVVEKICTMVLGESQHDYRLGNSKVFLKEYQHVILEKERTKALNESALLIQQNLKMWIDRKRFLTMRHAAIMIQKTWRGYGPRKKFKILREAIVRLQSRIKTRYYVADFHKKRNIMISLQAICRRYLVYKIVIEKQKQLQMNKVKDQQKKITNVVNGSSNEATTSSEQFSNECENNIDTIFNFLDNNPNKIVSRKTSNEIFADVIVKDVSRTNSLKISIAVIDSEVLSYDFYKFAAIYFTGNVTPHFSKRPIKHSLLDLPHPSDQLAARVLSITILRFMGDLEEPVEAAQDYYNRTVMRTISETLSKNYSNTDDFNKSGNKDRRSFLRLTLKKKNKLDYLISKGIINDEYDSWLSTERSNIEKLHFIIGHGILRPELKDEIYCQIVKQLINNPSKTSHDKGWILLMLCVGCFAPSEKLINYLKSFIKNDQSDYAPFCEKRLMRTYVNGCRTQPPCWIEMQSVKYKDPISLKVNLVNGSTNTIIADSASTAQEIVDGLAKSTGLKDVFGFSLFITIDDKILSLGSEGDHIMDAISQCEQYAKEQGHSERDAPWQLLFRKEMFAPWHDPAIDQIASDLIYQQICKGIKLGEYRCHDENDMAMIIAQQLFVECRSKTIPRNLKSVLRSYIPNQLILKDTEQVLIKLEKLTAEACEKISRSDIIDFTKIKAQVIMYAKNSWPLLFSRFFEASKIFGPEFNESEVIIAVNCTGIYLVDDKERILQQFSFPEISEVNYQKHNNTAVPHLTISTIQREEFIFESASAERFVTLVNHILDNLKQISTYVIAIQDWTDDDESEATLPLSKGDVIKLTNDYTGSTVMTSSWASGEKNGVKGKFPCEFVYVLPIMNKPSQKLKDIFKADFTSRPLNLMSQKSTTNVKESKHHTLKKFASEHFRPSMKAILATNSGISTPKSSILEELWKHTREPIKAPLLAKLASKDEQFKKAKQIFTNILRYMGDLPSNKQRISTEYTDKIFEQPLRDELLRDEVYCQIMRQLTGNEVRLSRERGWELMWLATGIMPCSSTVRKELELFLNSRDNVLAKDCLNRLNRITKSGTIRIYPPYILEVEAVRFKNLQIFHKIYFPDSTDAAFEVHSSTRAADMCDDISKKLQLRGRDGFSLFFNVAERAISVPQYYFFFDFIREVMDWITRVAHKQLDDTMDIQYQVLFKKKIWIDCLPGRDKNADFKFHFYQEAMNYLRGYHKCDKKDAIELAVLIYISGHGENKEELNHIHTKIQEYVPVDMIDNMTPKEWKKRIIASYSQKKGLGPDEAKELFLQRVYQLPTFGSVFFEVRQSTDTKFPEQVNVAINKNGVSIIDPRSKDILSMYSFTEISHWSSGDTYFHMTIGSFMNGRKVLCETAFGYKMDDLLSSYIAYLQGNLNRPNSHSRALYRSSSSVE